MPRSALNYCTLEGISRTTSSGQRLSPGECRRRHVPAGGVVFLQIVNRQNLPPQLGKMEDVRVEEKDLGIVTAAAAARTVERTTYAAAATEQEC